MTTTTATTAATATTTWQRELFAGVSGDATLIGSLTANEQNAAKALRRRFPLHVLPRYRESIDWANAQDPLRRLVVPTEEELVDTGHDETGGESASTVCRGVQHKYRQTAVLLLTQACAGHCRYCFRRRLLDRDEVTNEAIDDLDEALSYVRAHDEIDNVLLSGGDPFISSNKRLEAVFAALASIAHVRSLRISTKVAGRSRVGRRRSRLRRRRAR